VGRIKVSSVVAISKQIANAREKESGERNCYGKSEGLIQYGRKGGGRRSGLTGSSLGDRQKAEN